MELEFKGTKGEWHIFDYNLECVKFSHSEFDNKDCDLYKHQYDNIEEMHANAKLIAASPDLLEALRDLVWLYEKHALDNELKESINLKAKKAIEKAIK